MNYGAVALSEGEVRFLAEVDGFIARHVTDEVLRLERENGDGFNEALHLALGEKGWLAPEWPEDEGGAGLGRVEALALRKALAQSGAPYILSSTTLLPPISIRQYGPQWMNDEIIPAVAGGTVRICLGYTEPDTGSDLAGVRTRAVLDGDEWVITGQKMFTTGAQHSQYCFLLARTDTAAAKHRGLTVFLVPLSSDGIEIRPIHTLGGERTNFVFYDDVRIDDRYRIGPVNEGWAVITSGSLAAEHGLGKSGRTLEGDGMGYGQALGHLLASAIDWANRPGADGAQPGDDPLIRERLALVALHVQLNSLLDGPYGRVFSSDVLIQGASDILSMVGSEAGVEGPDPDALAGGDFAYYHRFAQGTAIYGGTVEIHRNMICERFLGLPRSTPKG